MLQDAVSTTEVMSIKRTASNDKCWKYMNKAHQGCGRKGTCLFQLRAPRIIHRTYMSAAQISIPDLYDKVVFIALISFYFCEELLQIQLNLSDVISMFRGAASWQLLNYTQNVQYCLWCIFVPNLTYPNGNGLLGITIRPKSQATFRTAAMLLFFISEKSWRKWSHVRFKNQLPYITSGSYSKWRYYHSPSQSSLPTTLLLFTGTQ
jgi:hypothetical protein